MLTANFWKQFISFKLYTILSNTIIILRNTLTSDETRPPPPAPCSLSTLHILPATKEGLGHQTVSALPCRAQTTATSLNNGLKCKVGDAGYQTAAGEDSQGFKGKSGCSQQGRKYPRWGC